MHIICTGHQINSTVSAALSKGIPNSKIIKPNEHDGSPCIGYGILRGTVSAFNQSKHWFEVDKGYFGPSHFDGTYRISYKGMWPKYKKPQSLDKLPNIKLRKWQYNKKGHILYCPATPAICSNFKVKAYWHNPILAQAKINIPNREFRVREKGCDRELLDDLMGAYCVVTHSSTVALKALIYGIPVVTSDFCTVHGWNHCNLSDLESWDKLTSQSREELFAFLAQHQWTLDEIRSGKCLMYISDMIAEKQ